MRLEGKVAIVTGGARHIGATYSSRLAAEGARVVIADVLDGSRVVQEIRRTNFLHYVASKAALIGMTRCMARELGAHGIRVNAIAPGLVEHEGQTAPKEFTEFQLKARSFKRVQTPEDLTGLLIYLASPDSDFVTGQTIVVDGGSILH